jgi:hypothetical protein
MSDQHIEQRRRGGRDRGASSRWSGRRRCRPHVEWLEGRALLAFYATEFPSVASGGGRI